MFLSRGWFILLFHCASVRRQQTHMKRNGTTTVFIKYFIHILIVNYSTFYPRDRFIHLSHLYFHVCIDGMYVCFSHLNADYLFTPLCQALSEQVNLDKLEFSSSSTMIGWSLCTREQAAISACDDMLTQKYNSVLKNYTAEDSLVLTFIKRLPKSSECYCWIGVLNKCVKLR